MTLSRSPDHGDTAAQAGLTIGSLFSGIGGLELGLERAGLGRTAWQVEQNEYCRAVLAKHWPDATRYEDVRHVGRSNLVPVDVICGGFPCQDVSNAGRKAGIIEGTRSGLWLEFSRIIRELRPGYVVVENVAALLTLGLDAVLGELAAIGYDAEWDCVPACAVGAPHERDRVFVVAYPSGHRRAVSGAWHEGLDAVASGGERLRGEPRRGRADSRARATANAVRARLEGHGEVALGVRAPQPRVGHHSGWVSEPAVGRVAYGVPARMERVRACGNAVVPQVAEVVGRVVLALEAQRLAEVA